MLSIGPWRLTRILLLIALAALAAQAIALDYVVDDAFISFRYARNLVEGHGLVYNPGGERVEGYTNLLWTLLMAAAIACRLDPAGGPLVLALIAHGLGRRGGPCSIAVVTFTGWILYVAMIGGDGLPMYRFVVPALPFLAILIASATARLRDTMPRGADLLAALALAMAILPGIIGTQSQYREWDARVFVPKLIQGGRT